jgi:hypothetical protein
MIIRQKCVLDEPKLVALKKMPIANIPILKDGLAVFASWAGGYDIAYDGYVVEPERIQGTYYQYNPTNDNLSFLFKLVEDYALEYGDAVSGFNYIPFEAEDKITLGINLFKSELWDNFNYTSPPTTYMPYELHGQFMMSLYYLKLYFGDRFDFAFWKTEKTKSLLSALAELKDYAFAANVPSKYARTNYSRDILGLYHRFMNLSLVEEYNIMMMPAKNVREDYLLQARQMLSEDLWPLYWLGFAATEKEQWEKGLGVFQELFSQDLAYSMESLPLAYQKAALCAEKSGNSQIAGEYNRIAGTLYNDYNITVDKNRTSFVGYYNGSWSVDDL